ncbi:hypothetical protein ACHAWF_006502 [Thalassiosira exigua]
MNRSSLLLAAALLLSPSSSSSAPSTFCAGFSFQLPQIRLPWDSSSAPPTSAADPLGGRKAPLRPGEKVVVFGGTGGVGQLAVRKLLSRDAGGKAYDVRVAARDGARARELLAGDDAAGELEVAELNLVGEDRASDDELRAVLDGAAGAVLAVGTTAFPTKRWAGGNTPKAIDEEAVTRIAEAAADASTLRRMVLLTSVGVDRTDQMPFAFLNLFGVLDAKRKGEDAIKSSASKSGFSYAIVRPGRLVGGPYTNLDLAKLFQIEGGASNGVTIERGDEGLGDCKRDACAEAVVQCLVNPEGADQEFSVVSNEERALTDQEWGEAFRGMRA